MTPILSSVKIAVKAVRQIGPLPVLQAALYQMGLRSGYWRWRLPAPRLETLDEQFTLHFPLILPEKAQLENVAGTEKQEILKEADEICSGKIRLFGGQPIPLLLAPKYTPLHWTAYETRKASYGTEDLKLTWEPGRFGWAITLARAYSMTCNENYAQTFWRLAEEFTLANPPYLGPHWASAQEVAIRIIAITIAIQMFDTSPAATFERKSLLTLSLAAQAARIPPTLIYARSQNNNHLLTESAGLITAGILLADLPQAKGWFDSGWHIFNRALQKQIARDGTYVQHSTNYHRLMLQTALWVHTITTNMGKEPFGRSTMERLAAATRWLLDQIDPLSGRVSNLGHNDGTYLLPFSSSGFSDYRPVLQAASRAFLGLPALPPGPWDELSLWLGLVENQIKTAQPENPKTSNIFSATENLDPGVQSPPRKNKAQKPKSILRGQDSWASLRAVRYTSRPAHCDQLQVDLWWNGQNLALDAGTYSYNAAAPWENALANTNVHNTVQVDGQDQMECAGRFLWLDWAQAYYLPGDSSPQRISAEHNGYQRIGVRHQRSLAYLGSNHWQVVDTLLPVHPIPEHHSAVLHWLLPDLPWELHGTTLRLKTNNGILSIRLALTDQTTAQTYLQLVRAGQVIAGPGKASPVLGWYSPTYNLKQPALSLRFFIEGVLPLSFSSDWFLPQ